MEAYRDERYRGSARVHLNSLAFDNDFDHRVDDGGNAISLERILEIQGCLRAQSHQSIIAAVRKKLGQLGPGHQWWVVDVYVEDQRGKSHIGGHST